MTDAKVRSVLIVGSVPLDSAAAVFDAVGTKLGKLVKRVPDGETGERFHWISFQNAILGKTKGLEPYDYYEVVPGWKVQRYKVSPGTEIEFGPLGYADSAIHSYEDFKRARADGKIASVRDFRFHYQRQSLRSTSSVNPPPSSLLGFLMRRAFAARSTKLPPPYPTEIWPFNGMRPSNSASSLKIRKS
jgi:hypothetical protein